MNEMQSGAARNSMWNPTVRRAFHSSTAAASPLERPNLEFGADVALTILGGPVALSLSIVSPGYKVRAARSRSSSIMLY
jgi:hypothetical protein